MPKERSINPAQQQRKEEKKRAVAKGKKQAQAQRNEKLVKRNPNRLQQQIDQLKELESQGVLRPRDKENLTQLEKDLRAIKRAREALPDAAPNYTRHSNDGGFKPRQDRQSHAQHLGKRRRGNENAYDSGSETDAEVRAIPMPRDTPPPIPRQGGPILRTGPDGQRIPHALPEKPVLLPPAQTTYSSAPQLRDLKKDAVRFLPAAVQAQKARVKGQGRLLEPEEMDKLEQAGYLAAKKAADAAEEEERRSGMAQQVQPSGDTTRGLDLDKEAERFEREMAELIASQGDGTNLRHVQMDEVDDDGT